jgi:hypothetical protein
VLGYVSYRNIACPSNLFYWQCQDKQFQNHYDDIMQLVTIGGVLYATGPTVRFNLMVKPLLLYGSSLFAFGAFGEVPFLMNSLNSPDAWVPPSLFVYMLALALIIGFLTYALRTARSRYEFMLSMLILTVLAAVYSSGAFFAVGIGAPAGSITFHPHHYAIAW